MRELYPQDAVWEIVSAARSEQRPFFFLVGAGLSAPYVPLAHEVIAHCHARAEAERGTVDRKYLDTLDEYSFWFERAYPQALQRRKYLESIIRPKGRDSVTRAALRLAHLVGQGDIARLVVTPNFDESVTTAFRLFGTPHVVCDHPATAPRIDPERDVVQVVHVHGTFWFYDCCNLAGEVDERAEVPPMSALLDLILSRRSPIVIGYSGWERDVFMTALRRRLGNRLPVNLYWFCHTQADAQRLPGWLTDHQDVAVVTAEDASLPAMAVLDLLISEAGAPTPELVTDPMTYFADLLDGMVPNEEKTSGYVFGEAIDRLREAALHRPAPTVLTAIRAAVREARHDDLVRSVADMPEVSLSPEQIEEIATAIADIGDAYVFVKPAQMLAAAERMFALLETLPPTTHRDELVAEIGLVAIKHLFLLGQRDELERLMAQLLDRFSGQESTRAPAALGMAMMYQAMSRNMATERRSFVITGYPANNDSASGEDVEG